ncbi:MAG: hypothetical protein R3C61_15970 [Bacteroidia bacterium]
MENQEGINTHTPAEGKFVSNSRILLLLLIAGFMLLNLIGQGNNRILKSDCTPTPLNLDPIKKQIGYPLVARELGIQGSVVFKIEVNPQGDYVRHICINPIPILTPACERYIPDIEFSLGDCRNNRKCIWIELPFNFINEAPAWVTNEYEKGLKNQASGRYKVAIAHFTEASKQQDLFQVQALLQRGITAYHLEDFELAEKDFRHVLDQKDFYIQSWKNATSSPSFKVPIDLIEDPLILALERSSFKKLIIRKESRLDSLASKVQKAYKLE